MNELTKLYAQLETAETVSERFEILMNIKAIEKKIESSRDQSPAFY
jgi:hypothetical protein